MDTTGFLFSSEPGNTPRGTQYGRHGASSNHGTAITTFSGAFNIESYHAYDNNVPRDAHRSKPNRNNRRNRLSHLISEAGYKMYRGFIGSQHQKRQHAQQEFY